MALKEITMPDLGGAADVTVIEVLVKQGDTVALDAPIITLESDKATMEVPATEAGVVKEIKVKVGDKVSTGTSLITVEPAAGDHPASENKTPDKEAKPENKVPDKETKAENKAPDKETKPENKTPDKETKEAPEKPAKPLPDTADEDAGDVHAGPGVRRLARELGVNLADVSGTGPKQRVLKEDLQAFVKHQLAAKQTSSSPSTPLPVIDFSKFGSIETKSLSRLKKISGLNLQRNWAMIPHVTQFGEADITTLEEFREAQKTALDKQQIKLTPLVFAMKAVVSSLKAFPHFNASLDTAGEQLIVKNYFHIGVAVDTQDGLVVPVIRDVDKRGVIELAQELAKVSEKARNKQLTPMDMQGGCFSVSSLGGIGGTAFTPIINYPEVAILGVSKTSYQPVYQAGSFVPRLMLPLSLSYDHRVIDGAEGARFMVHLTRMLSDIRNLLL